LKPRHLPFAVKPPPASYGASGRIRIDCRKELSEMNNETWYNFVIALSLLVLTLTSCGKDPTSPGTSTVICPLSIGNHWTYVDSTFYGGSVWVDSSRLGITGKTTVPFEGNSYEVYFWNWYEDDLQQYRDYKWLMRNEDDGLWSLGGTSSSDTLILETMIVKYPVSAADTWPQTAVSWSSWDSSFFARDTLVITCVATDEQFATAAGTFRCCVYHYSENYYAGNSNPWVSRFKASVVAGQPAPQNPLNLTNVYLYFAPGVGYVGLIVKESDEVVGKRSLLSFHLE
jgi:hypothetical protein